MESSMKSKNPYAGEEILLTSMHEKEKVLSSSCQEILGAFLISSENLINTDLLGSFSGEHLREKNEKETAIEKCRLGMKLLNKNLGIASEGSFGAHPHIPFLTANTETLVFIDDKRGLTLFETRIFLNTNHHAGVFDLESDLSPFLKKSLFPSHALIVKPNIPQHKELIFKGINTLSELEKAISVSCQDSLDGKAYIETDMRAHKNPTRLKNIESLGICLFQRIAQECPLCESPGFGLTNIQRGRPCNDCKTPTSLITKEIWSCASCKHSEEIIPLDLPLFADPGNCPVCNP
jgi:hypothetical protein